MGESRRFHFQFSPIFLAPLIAILCCAIIPIKSLRIESEFIATSLPVGSLPTESSIRRGLSAEASYVASPSTESNVTVRVNRQNNSIELDLFGKINEKLKIISYFLVFLCICLICALIAFILILRNTGRDFPYSDKSDLKEQNVCLSDTESY